MHLSAALAILGHAVHISLNTQLSTNVNAGVYLLAPLLRTLTKTVSEDSVIAMTAGLLILHLYLHDYK